LWQHRRQSISASSAGLAHCAIDVRLGRKISFRILHGFEFRGGLISRENVWLDSTAIVSQSS
jgi:hypothetical protein